MKRTFSSPETALFWSAPRIATSGLLVRSNDIPVSVLNGFVNTTDWDQNQSDLSDLSQSMRRVTGSPWFADFRCWTWWRQTARGRDSWSWPKGARPLGTRMFPIKQEFLVLRAFKKFIKKSHSTQIEICFTEVHCIKYRSRWENTNFHDMGTSIQLSWKVRRLNQSRSKGEIRGWARRKERLSRSKFK